MRTQIDICILTALLCVSLAPELKAQGTVFSYEGHFLDNGSPASGIYDLRFAVFDAEGAGNQVGPSLTNSTATVSNGLFTVALDFNAGVFTGPARWLEIGVRTNGAIDFTTLSPRHRITATPYAITAGNLTGIVPPSGLSGTYPGPVIFNNAGNRFTGNGGALTNVNAASLGGQRASNFWQIAGNAGTIPGMHFLGTTDNQPLELKVNGLRSLRLEPTGDSSDAGALPDGAPNVIGGAPNNFVAAAVVGATIAGGGATNYFGAASPNSIASDYATIGGGYLNSIQAASAGSMIGGGQQNTVMTRAFSSSIGGGEGNNIATDSPTSTIAGGRSNSVGTNANASAIGGGAENKIANNAFFSTIAGGGQNQIGTNAVYSTIGGGFDNDIAADSLVATIAGGGLNDIGTNSDYSAIGGGYDHDIAPNAPYSTIAGGWSHHIGTNSAYSTIAGGRANNIGANSVTSAIGGGEGNNIGPNAAFATVPGGHFNSATNYAFAAGRRAKANHIGAFVWADSTDADFASTNANQFNVRASGGVRFVTGAGGLSVDGQPVLSGTVPSGRLSGTYTNALTFDNAANNFAGTFAGNGAGLSNLAGVLRWQVVSGTSHAAEPNAGYVLTHVDQVTVTLPSSPGVGEVIRLSGAGASGWRLSQNGGQTILAANLGSRAGVRWTAHESGRFWTAIASSANGTKLVAAVGGGQIYTSTDSGVTWTARETSRRWSSVASSADGTKLLAAVGDMALGRLYTSTDSGVSWTARESVRGWRSVASSADGTKLVAVIQDGRVFTSIDSGVSWTDRGLLELGLTGVASSADGSKLVVTAGGSALGQIYTSINSGVNWSVRESARNWDSVASSADGSKLVAVVNAGQIYTSTDSGTNWVARENARVWSSVASSADGSKLVAVVEGGQVYTSTDSGATWTAGGANTFWRAVACSADGNKIAAAVGGVAGQIHTSNPNTTIGTGGYLIGAHAATLELQYVGDNQFLPLSHEGTISAF